MSEVLLNNEQTQIEIIKFIINNSTYKINVNTFIAYELLTSVIEKYNNNKLNIIQKLYINRHVNIQKI
jgi:hypothetical protein